MSFRLGIIGKGNYDRSLVCFSLGQREREETAATRRPHTSAPAEHPEPALKCLKTIQKPLSNSLGMKTQLQTLNSPGRLQANDTRWGLHHRRRNDSIRSSMRNRTTIVVLVRREPEQLAGKERAIILQLSAEEKARESVCITYKAGRQVDCPPVEFHSRRVCASECWLN